MTEIIAEPSVHSELVKEIRKGLAKIKHKINFVLFSFAFIPGRLCQILIVGELVHACRTK